MAKLNEQINIKLIVAVITVFTITGLNLCIPCNAKSKEVPRETAVVKAVRRVSPAVVNISSEYEIRKRSSPFSGFGIDPFFDSFFKDFFEPGFERRYKRASLGSGVIIDGKRGFILTNAHVIAKTGKITAVLKDEREFEAQIVGADPDSDLAVLRIASDKKLPAIEMGNSDDLMIGETIIAIGNPFGFSNTVTTGVISAIKRSIRTEDAVFHDFIQTDASINPGNSGGPLLNINGELIGINTAIYAKAQGIGFAIPINKAKRVISDLIRYGEVIPAWIGIMVQDIDARMARYLRLKSSDGVLITKVDRPSPARKAGIQDGDVLISIDGRKIHSTKGYQTAMKNFAAGETLKLKIQRKGRGKTVSVAAEVFPLELAMDLAYELLGITVENLSFKKRFGHKTTAEEGVIISKINPQSYLGRIGVAPGDVIRQIDEMTIKDVKDFKKAVVKYRQKPSVVVLLQRRDDLYNITVRL